MTDTLRGVLEIGKKRRVVAGAMQREDAADTEIDAGLAARIEQLRRE